eukprot:SAG31_NODE_9597_length_1253_cov_1.855286_1_plen_366_part_10
MPVYGFSNPDDGIPEGTAGEILEVSEDGSRTVRFPTGTWDFDLVELVLAGSKQAAAWDAWKQERTAQMVVGVVVTWTCADDDIPEGMAGEIVIAWDDGQLCVRFPTGRWTLDLAEVEFADMEQMAEWDAWKARKAAQVAQMIVGAVVTCTFACTFGDMYICIPKGTAGEIVEDVASQSDGIRLVKFPDNCQQLEAFDPDKAATSTHRIDVDQLQLATAAETKRLAEYQAKQAAAESRARTIASRQLEAVKAVCVEGAPHSKSRHCPREIWGTSCSGVYLASGLDCWPSYLMDSCRLTRCQSANRWVISSPFSKFSIVSNTGVLPTGSQLWRGHALVDEYGKAVDNGDVALSVTLLTTDDEVNWHNS